MRCRAQDLGPCAQDSPFAVRELRPIIGRLHVDLLSERKRVVDLDAEVSNGALELGVTEQKLHGPQVAGAAVDPRCLGTRSECVP